jgi:dihydroorotate dehydrogenase
MHPETAHQFVFGLLKFFNNIPGFSFLLKKFFVTEHKKLQRRVFGLTFPNPVGLAAGFDKDAKLYDELSLFGFGFIEIGTLTPQPQPGNPKPRMFRLPEDHALINRMGFNNDGVQAAHLRLRKRKPGLIIGGNIGKNKGTLNADAWKDYEICFRALFDVVDYFVVNVSSPNTAGLRELQEKEPLLNILNNLQKLNRELSSANAQETKPKPLLLKISPDLSEAALDEIIEVCQTTRLDGIIATNTTIERCSLKSDGKVITACGAGGLSGLPLKDRSTEMIRYIHKRAGGNLIIIGVGGIHSAQDAIEKINAGASLVQLYTGFIYEGPCLISQINKALLKE